jgi:hypothetical protein
MNIADTRKCNLFNLEMLAGYINVPATVLTTYYEELLGDGEFIRTIFVFELDYPFANTQEISTLSSLNEITVLTVDFA